MKKWKRQHQHGGQAAPATDAQNIPNWKAMAILHRGPHSQGVVDLLGKIFGAAGAAIGQLPLALPDGTVLYAAAAAAETIPKIIAAIEGDPSAAQHLAVIEPTPAQIQQLDQLHEGRNWPTLPTPAQ